MTATSDLSPLQIPSWVPSAVADDARRAWLKFKSQVEREGRIPPYIERASKLLKRLVCDERMRNVWRELSKRRRRDGEFMYPTRLEPGEDKDTQQIWAMDVLFQWVVFRALHPDSVITCRKAEQRHKETLDKAKQLREDAARLFVESIFRSTLGSSRLPYRELEQRPRVLYRAAKILENYAAENLAFDMNTALKRGRGDGDIHWLALGVAKVCRTLFGSPMYGVTATIVSVALDHDIDARTVRQWCAHPADKPPKTVR